MQQTCHERIVCINDSFYDGVYPAGQRGISFWRARRISHGMGSGFTLRLDMIASFMILELALL